MTMALSDICTELGVEIVATAESARKPGQTCAARILQKVLTDEGENHLRSVLITILQTENNKRMLVRPVILAVSDVLRAHPDWFGSKWLDAFDKIELAELYQRAKAEREGFAPRAAIAAWLVERLRDKFHMEEQARLL